MKTKDERFMSLFKKAYNNDDFKLSDNDIEFMACFVSRFVNRRLGCSCIITTPNHVNSILVDSGKDKLDSKKAKEVCYEVNNSECIYDLIDNAIIACHSQIEEIDKLTKNR